MIVIIIQSQLSGTTVDNTQIIGNSIANGRYAVRSLLGEGGMGQVLLADDRNLGSPVVIKVPHAALLRDQEFAARFQREIRSLVKLSHPHIVKITDVGEHEGLPFAVMQYLDGGSLEDRLTGGPMSQESLSDWLPEIVRALDFIHREGYIHRDIKPANILFDREGHAYLSDFGIAKAVGDLEPGRKAATALTGAGMVLGTAEYMAPELVMGEAFDHRVDQYALAVTVYEVLSGQTPFRGPTAAAIMVKQTTEAVPDLGRTNPAVSASVAGAVSQALSKQADERFGSCDEFAAALVPRATSATSTAPRENSTAMHGENRISLACPQCGRELRAGPQHGGKVIRCPGCQTKLRVSANLSQLLELPASSTPTATTAFPIVTSLQPSPASVRQRGPVPAGKKSRRTPLPAWLPWSVGVGVAAVLVPMAILFLRPGGGIAIPPVVTTDPAQQDVAEPAPVLTASNADTSKETQLDPATLPAEIRNPEPGPESNPVQDNLGSPAETPQKIEAPSEITNSIGMQLKLIAAGQFLMGSDETKEHLEAAGFSVPFDISDESPEHDVQLTQDFYLGMFEVTKGQFAAFVRANNYKTDAERDGLGGWGYDPEQKEAVQNPKYSWQNTGFAQTDNHPVVNVSWNDAEVFCEWLSTNTGETYHLPTEAEWEYACRGGTTTRYSTGDAPVSLSGFANVQDASFELKFPDSDFAKYPSFPFHDNSAFTSSMGGYQANSFGLYDMHGNVWEWCQDWYGAYSGETATDPHGPETGSDRVFRGGGWYGTPMDVRSAFRGAAAPDFCYCNLGFRVARSSIR